MEIEELALGVSVVVSTRVTDGGVLRMVVETETSALCRLPSKVYASSVHTSPFWVCVWRIVSPFMVCSMPSFFHVYAKETGSPSGSVGSKMSVAVIVSWVCGASGDKLTMVDIQLYVNIFYWDTFNPGQYFFKNLQGKVPWVQAWYDRMHARPAVAAARTYAGYKDRSDKSDIDAA